MKEILFDIEHVSYHYPDGTKALDNINLVIEKSVKIALLGANGAGKSTFLLHLNGTLKPKKGTIHYKGNPMLYSKKSLDQLRQEIGIVFQDPDSQLFSASVFQDISFGPMNLKLDKESVKERVIEAMELTEVAGFSQKPTHALSYGQKKRVAIAGVLAMKPEVIIVDEPTASLDPKQTDVLISLLDQLNHDGKTIIMSTHDVEAAWKFADYIYVLKDGGLFAHGEPVEIFSNEEVLKDTDLRKPFLLELVEKLSDLGLLPSSIFDDINKIRSKEQLYLLLAESMKGKHDE